LGDTPGSQSKKGRSEPLSTRGFDKLSQALLVASLQFVTELERPNRLVK